MRTTDVLEMEMSDNLRAPVYFGDKGYKDIKLNLKLLCEEYLIAYEREYGEDDE